MTEVHEARPERSSAEKQKISYLASFAANYIPEMRAVFRGGKLTKGEGWRNVAEHCFMSGVGVDIIAEALELPEEDRRALVSSAILSDSGKRWEKRPEQFNSLEAVRALLVQKLVNGSLSRDLLNHADTQQEQWGASLLAEIVNAGVVSADDLRILSADEQEALGRFMWSLRNTEPSKDFYETTGPDFYLRIRDERAGGPEVPFLTKVADLIDNMTDGTDEKPPRSVFNPPGVRVPKVVRPERWGDLDNIYKEAFGGISFVPYVVAYNEEFQEQLFARLQEKLDGTGKDMPESANSIAAWLNREVARRAHEHAYSGF